MNFKKDLEFSRIGEDVLIDHLKPQHIIRAPNKVFKDYDLILDDVSYEVKTDRYTDKTGNLCIEFECRGKPSGISTTKANYYAYVCYPSKQLYIIPTTDIQTIISNGNYRTIKGGNDKQASFYLIKKDTFKEFIV